MNNNKKRGRPKKEAKRGRGRPKLSEEQKKRQGVKLNNDYRTLRETYLANNGLFLLTEPLDTTKNLILDIQEVIDYCFCPQFYELSHSIDSIVDMSYLYEQTLKRTFSAYLRAFQSGTRQDTLSFLKNEWGRNWIRFKNEKELLVFRNKHYDTYDSKRKAGIDAIYNFEEFINKDSQLPIIINHKYEIQLDNNIILTGTIDYVRQVTIKDEPVIQLINYRITTRSLGIANIEKRLNLSSIANAYAFKELFDIDKFQIVDYEPSTNRINIYNYDDKEFNLLKQTVKDTAICIANNLKPISPSKTCHLCHFRNVCNNVF